MVLWLQHKFGRTGMHAIPVSAAEQLRLQDELLQQPVPQLASTTKMSMIIIIYPFEILNIREWKSINWASNDFSARGKHVVSFLTILLDPACPAGTVVLVWLPQACRYSVFREPTFLVCVRQQQELLWARRIQVSPLTFPVHCTCLNCTAQGKKWVETEVGTWSLNPIPFICDLWTHLQYVQGQHNSKL